LLYLVFMHLCECGCGQQTRIAERNRRALGHVKGKALRFINGHAGKSAHFHPNIRHGMSLTPEWKAWHNAKDRCSNPRNKSFKRYGARGIKFLFTNFEQFFEAVGPRPSALHSLERINNGGHYELGNIRWATGVEQQANRRPIILTLEERQQIIGRRQAGESGPSLAAEFGVTVQYIYSLAKRSVNGRFPASIR